MSETVYDRHAELYLEFIDRALAAGQGPFHELLALFERLLAERLSGARVLDVACGEGYVARSLAKLGAREVIGVDISATLIRAAIDRTDADNVSFAVGDAMQLDAFADVSVDVVVSQMAMMDIDDHRAVYAAVRRVLRPEGAFAFSLLHPCFESPHREPDEPRSLLDVHGEPSYRMVGHYATEGHWQSGASGLRGHVGSYHRMLSTYVNDLIDAGFVLERLEEPVVDVPGIYSQVPRVVMIVARAA